MEDLAKVIKEMLEVVRAALRNNWAMATQLCMIILAEYPLAGSSRGEPRNFPNYEAGQHAK
jgi:hypothetical protein